MQDSETGGGELVTLETEPVATLAVAWRTSEDGDKLTYELNVEGNATDRRWLAATLLQLAAAVAREPWDWEEGEADDDDPGPEDALPFRSAVVDQVPQPEAG